MKIRKADCSDVKEIFELINQFSNTDLGLRPITKQEILKELDNFFIVEEKKFCGCGRIVTYSDVCEICSICIKKEYQKKGYGSKLLKKLIEASNKKYIAVHTTLKNRKFFEKNSFKYLGTAPKVYLSDKTPDYIREMVGDCVQCDKFPNQCPEIIMVYEKNQNI